MRYMLLAVLLVGCGGEEDIPGTPNPVPQPAACAKPAGLYRVAWTKQSGTCGAIPEAIVNLDTNPSPMAGTIGATCKGTAQRDAACAIAFDEDCNYGSQGSAILRGTMSWSADAARGNGTVSMTSAGVSGLCTAVYGVVYSRP